MLHHMCPLVEMFLRESAFRSKFRSRTRLAFPKLLKFLKSLKPLDILKSLKLMKFLKFLTIPLMNLFEINFVNNSWAPLEIEARDLGAIRTSLHNREHMTSHTYQIFECPPEVK